MQNAVNSETNPQVLLPWFDVDVGGPLIDRPGDDGVYEFDDRCLVD